MLYRGVVAVACLSCGAISPAVSAQSVTVDLGTSRSNTLFEDPLGETSGGASEWIFAGLTQQPLLRRGLLAFDVSSIPAGSTITGVTLTLHMSRTSAGNESFTLNRVLSNWGSGGSVPLEPGGFGAPAQTGDATWLNTFYDPRGVGATWTSPGGDFDPEALASTVVGGVGFYSWSSDALAADVQRWLDEGAGANFGWMLLGNESVLQSAKRFDSAFNAEEANRPRLTVTYTVPVPGVAGLSACAGLAAFRRRRRSLVGNGMAFAEA